MWNGRDGTKTGPEDSDGGHLDTCDRTLKEFQQEPLGIQQLLPNQSERGRVAMCSRHFYKQQLKLFKYRSSFCHFYLSFFFPSMRQLSETKTVVITFVRRINLGP